MRDNIRYLVGVAFAALVFLAGFYALVLYEFALDQLIVGAFISLMTLAAQFVFGEVSAATQGRRAQQSFEAGTRKQGEQDGSQRIPE